MFGKDWSRKGRGFALLVRSLFICALLFSCARPIYVQGDSPGGSEDPQRKTDTLCPISFVSTQSPSPGYCLKWSWEVSPKVGESDASLIFKIYRLNAYDTPLEKDPNLKPALVLWMPGMGHGSSPTSIEALDQFTFRAKNLIFFMPGEWDLRFQMLNGVHRQEEAIVPITL
jgi:hypothetical protein